MNKLSSAVLLALCVTTTALANENGMAPELTLARIIEKNNAARGGLEAWRKIESMAWTGHIESPNSPASTMRFELEMKRPNKTRFEVAAKTQLAVRVFDGSEGWKMHPASSGKPDLQPFTREELNFAHDGQGIDGPLIDYAAKGIAVALEGSDEIGGRKAYRLNARLPSGVSESLWIDAQTFLEIKAVRMARNAFGQSTTSSVVYRNYQRVDGLNMPFVIESGADASQAPNRMVIENVVINPSLDDRVFAKPRLPGHRGGVPVDTRSAAASPRPVNWPTAAMASDKTARSAPAPASGAEP